MDRGDILVGKPRLLGYDAFTGISEYFQFDDETKEFTIFEEQDIEPIVAENASFMADHDERAPWRHKGSYDAPIRVAQIPAMVWRQMRKRGITPRNRKAYVAFLNDPDNKIFRTRPGRI